MILRMRVMANTRHCEDGRSGYADERERRWTELISPMLDTRRRRSRAARARRRSRPMMRPSASGSNRRSSRQRGSGKRGERPGDSGRGRDRTHRPAMPWPSRAFLAREGLTASDIDVIGFHGQTVLHRPREALTVQLGDGVRLAKRLGIDVVHDLRANDMRLRRAGRAAGSGLSPGACRGPCGRMGG